MTNSNWLERTEILLDKKNLNFLQSQNVLVVGTGGVGGFACECLCRAGIGNITIVDGDTVCDSNRNRQLIALSSTVGQSKTEIMKNRLLDINPDLNIQTIPQFIKEDEMYTLFDQKYDHVIDAIDTLTPKIHLILECLKQKTPLVSSMGAGGKFDCTQIQIADISKSYNCTLARMLRKQLNKMGIRKGFQVVFSPEKVDKSRVIPTDGTGNKKSVVGTISWMPAMFGANCAYAVLKKLLAYNNFEI